MTAATVTRKFTEEQVGLIRRTMMEGASPDDVAVFVATCERTGLDPFARQIMPQKRTSKFKDARGNWSQKTVWSTLTTIDGLRKIAVDSGAYEGQEGPYWCGQDGDWKDVWLAPTAPKASRVVVHRTNFKHGLTGVALFDSYAQRKQDGTLNNIWETLGEVMIAKCAEALALRKAFPNEMAGLYTTDEMPQADNPKHQGKEEAPEPPPEAKPAAEPTAQPAVKPKQDEPWGHWSLEQREQFSILKGRLYEAMKAAGAADGWNDQNEKWSKFCMESATPDAALERLRVFVEKCEDALKHKAEAPPQQSPSEDLASNWEKVRAKAPYSKLTAPKWKGEMERMESEWSADREDAQLAILEGQRKLLRML